MLASAVSSSSSGSRAHPLLQPMAVDQRVVAEHQAIAPRGLAGSMPVRYGRVDAFERVDEAGAERPTVVVASSASESYGLSSSIIAHMCGTSSGMS